MSLPPPPAPEAPLSGGPPKKDFPGLAVLGVVLGGLALVTLISMARSVFQASAPPPAAVQDFLIGRSLVDFTLTNTAGQSVRRADLQDRWLVVNFVFSGCALSCLQVNYRMGEIQKLVADQPDVRLVSLTIDPRSDPPPVLAKFAAQFHPDTNRWIFLTGDRRELYPLIEQSFLGPQDPKLAGRIPGGWNHIDRIALVDPRGELRQSFDGMRPNAAREVVAALAELKRGRAR